MSLSTLAVLVASGAPTVGCYQCNYPCPSAFDVAGFCLTPTGSKQPSSCLIDGQPVAQCDPGSCPAWTLAAGDTLTIPAGAMWPTLGPRNDLHWFVNCLSQASATPDGAAEETPATDAPVQETSVSDSASSDGPPEDAAAQGAPLAFASASPQMPGTLTVLFDGVPAQGCICTPNTEITCLGVASTVQTIGFRYVSVPTDTIAAESGPGESAGASSEGGSDAGGPNIGLAIAFDVGECVPTHLGCPHSDVPEGSAY